jgi:hypothetical protein
MTDDNNYDDNFQPPTESRSVRTIARRSRSSSRGAIVAKLPAQPQPRIIQFESKLEQRVLHLYLARPDIWDVWEQPPSLVYRDEDRAVRQHFFDFLITLTSGRRLAVAVKPLKRVTRSGFISVLRRMRQQMTKEFADDIVLVTDADFTRDEALNAERYHAFGKGVTDESLSHVKGLIKKIDFPCSVRQLVDDLGGGSAAYRSVFVAIYREILSADRTQLIDLDTVLSAGDLS